MNFDALPDVALARDLLRRWWGVDLDLATVDELGKVTHGACEQGRTKPEGKCSETLAALAKAFAGDVGPTPGVDAPAQRRGSKPRPGDAGPTPGVDASAHRRGPKSQPIDQSPQTVACHGGLLVIAAPIVDGTKLSAIVHASGIRPELTDAEKTRIADFVLSAAAAVDRSRPAVIAPTTFSHPYNEIVGDAPAVRDVVKLLGKVVKSEATVLIHGESGTGKELIARAIHYHGPRAKKPFVVQNCSAFNDNLLESALFGHVRGAFTGAVKDQPGLFQTADGGTFFLDEIGDMSAALQVKLLRVLQEGTLMPVGGTKNIKVDVRIIAASHKDLQAMVAHKQFREDLFYRVNVLKITVPPLRERTSDIPRLALHFVTKHWRGSGPVPRLSQGALARLVAHQWPGNIRELENEIERMLVLAGNDAQELTPGMVSPRVAGGAALGRPLRDTLAVAESDAIVAALGRHIGDRDLASDELGLARDHLDARIVALGLESR